VTSPVKEGAAERTTLPDPVLVVVPVPPRVTGSVPLVILAASKSASVVTNVASPDPSNVLVVPVTPPVTVIVLPVAHCVAVAAFPEVSCVPAVSTPGRVIAADPLKFTPPIVLGVVRVAADPVVLWFRVGIRAASSVPVVMLVAFRAVSPEPFPKNVPAVTFPVATRLLDTVRPVIALENTTVFDVVAPKFVIFSRLSTRSDVKSVVTYTFPDPI